MRRTSAILAILLLLVFAVTPIASAQDYTLGPGDVIAVGVWGFEDLPAKELIIRPDGKIAFPLAGELLVTGLSSGELTKQLTTRLREQINDPEVTVNIVKYRTTRVYVLGEITKPGMYELEKQHNVLDAISAAGGYTKDTAKKKVFIVKRADPKQRLQANLLDIMERGDMRQNYALEEGDIVYLTRNGRIDLGRDIMPFLTLIGVMDALRD